MLSKLTVIQSILPNVRLIFSDGETVMIDFSSSKEFFLSIVQTWMKHFLGLSHIEFHSCHKAVGDTEKLYCTFDGTPSLSQKPKYNQSDTW